MDNIKDMDDKAYIAALLEKYMDGETSNAEEALLKRYFGTAGDDIPEEWRIYKALFRYEAEEKKNATVEKPVRIKKTTNGRRMWTAGIISAAASIAILVCLFLTLPRNEKNYAVIDGKKYTNKTVVMQEAEEALSLVSSSDDDTFDALEQIQ